MRSPTRLVFSSRLAPLAFAIVLVAVVSHLPAVPTALAGTDARFRCGSRLVPEGETGDDVPRKCGKPDAVRSWTEYEPQSVWEGGRKIERSVAIVYDEWKFDFGRDRLIRYATFVQGRLAFGRTGGYGE